MNIDLQSIITLVGVLAGGSGLASIIIAINTRKKSKASATKIIEEAAASLVETYKRDNEAVRMECSQLKDKVNELTCKLDLNVESLEREIDTLREEIKTLKMRNSRLILGIDRLIYQIKSKGDTPVVDPKELLRD